MSRVPLTNTKKWELVHSNQDLRGRDLWDAHGHKLGTIREMVLDTSSKRVETVILDTGDKYAAQDLAMDQDAVYVLNYDASVEPPPSVRLQREAPEDRPSAADGGETRADRSTDSTRQSGARRTYTDYRDEYRKHYDTEFSNLNRDYTDFEPAYRFGYDMAFEHEYSGRDFDAAEEQLRRDFYSRMGYPMSDRHVWDDVRQAVRHAFTRARQDEQSG